jgi:hypothetical protein
MEDRRRRKGRVDVQRFRSSRRLQSYEHIEYAVDVF